MPPPKPRVPPYLLMLLLSVGLLCLIGYQTLKDRRISGDLLKRKDALIQDKIFANHKLEQLLQKEKKKTTDLQEKLDRLSTQKEELNGLKDGLSGRLIELGHVKKLTEEDKKQLESSLQDKEKEAKDLKEKLILVDEQEEILKALKKDAAQKDAEINDLKAQIKEMEKHGGGSMNASGRAEDRAEEMQEKFSKKDLDAGEAIVEKTIMVDEDKEGSKGQEVERDTEDSKGKETAHKHSEDEQEGDAEDSKGKETTHKHSEEQAGSSQRTSGVQDMDIEDEESRVDDREDPLSDDDAEAEADAEKIHEEDENDEQEQPDVDIKSVAKTDPDENEIAAVE